MATINLTKESAERLAHFQNKIEADRLAGIVRPAEERERLVNELVDSLSRQGDIMAYLQQPDPVFTAVQRVMQPSAATMALIESMQPTEAESRMLAALKPPAALAGLLAMPAHHSFLAPTVYGVGVPASLPAAPAPAKPREQPEPPAKPIAPADWRGLLEQALKADKNAEKQALALIVKHAGPDEGALRAELIELEEYERKWLKVKGKVTPEAFAKDKKSISRAGHYRLLDRLKEVRLLLSALSSETK